MRTLRVDTALSEGRVKLHLFKPSGRYIWTVVGREDEYWLDPDTGYCSCQKFYFGSGSCYHLVCQRQAIQQGRYSTVTFDDQEFDGLVLGVTNAALSEH